MSAAVHPDGTALPALRSDTLADSVLILLGLTLAQRLIGFVRSVLFCRWLDAEQLGQWDLSFSFLMLAAPVAVLGLPGSFGRYSEHYRRRGQVKTFLFRVGAASAALAAAATLTVGLGKRWFSELIFGGQDAAALVVWLAAGLGAWIAHCVLISLFNALRMTRVVSALQFVNSVAFAALGAALVLIWRRSAAVVVAAFGGACLLSTVLGLVCLRRTWRDLADTTRNAPHLAFWTRLAPFAFWMWVTNALTNLFGLADRYMIVHFSGLAESDVLAQIGQYHSARFMPLLFLGIAEMLAALITPYLSHDWEAGRRDAVSRRLNLILKMFAFALTAAGTLILLAAPLLFGVALNGKYAAGLALLPWTLMFCTWGSLAVVATNYLWCAEKARLASWAMLLGLVVSVALNAYLLPRYGLLGAVWATSAANLVLWLAMYGSACRQGMQFDGGTCLASLAPLGLCLGPGTALCVLLALTVEATAGRGWLRAEERAELAAGALRYRDRVLNSKLFARP